MSALAKKWDGTLVVTLRLTLKPGRDDDLITIVEAAPARGLAATVREAMRGGIPIRSHNVQDEASPDLTGLGQEL